MDLLLKFFAALRMTPHPALRATFPSRGRLFPSCHSEERSDEESQKEILRSAQDDSGITDSHGGKAASE